MHAEGYVSGRPESDTEAEIREEHLAWLVTDAAARETSLGKRILAKLRAFLVKLGFVRFVSTDALVELARGAAMKAAGQKLNAAFARAPATDTPAFKRWFGDSKVVDADGNPLVVYHGTGADFVAFNPAFMYSGEGASQTGSGFYFTDNPDSASRYADLATTKGQPGQVVPVFLSLKKPLFIDFQQGETTGAKIKLTRAQVRKIILSAPNIRSEEDSPLLNFGDIGYEGFDKVLGEAVRLYAGGSNIAALRNDFFDKDHAAWLRAFSKATGYDSAYTKTAAGDTHYVAWFPEQIKSAIGNRGTFDTANPDIRFAREVESDVEEAIRPAAAASRRTLKQRAQAVVDLIDAKTNPLATLSGRTDYLKSRYLTLGRIAQSQQTARRIYDTFRGLSDADGQKVYAYLTDAEGVLEGVSPTVKANATRVKAQINEVGMALVERGVIPLESFEKHQGRYLPRIYLAYLLGDRAVAAVGAGKTLSSQGYAKRRNDDLPQEYRDVVLGEIKDPAFLASKALGVPLRDIAIMTWLTQIAENPAWVLPGQTVEWTMPGFKKPRKVTPFWLKAEASRLRERAEHYQGQNKTDAVALAAQMDELADATLRESGIRANEVPDGFKQIPDSARYGALRGLVVKAEIHTDLVGLGRIVSADAGIAEKVLGYGGWGTKAVNLWKWSKVAANPPAQVRNIVSNFVLLNLSGVPLHRMPALIVRAVKEIRKKGRFYQIGVKYGITESSFAAQEMQRIERETLDYLARQKGRFSFAQLVEYFNRFRDLTGDAYQLSEMIGKLVKIMDSMDREGKTEADAALAAQEWLFDYSLVGQNTRYLRNAPIGAPFLTFAVKVLPRLLEVAITAPWRFLPYAGLFYAASLAVQSMTGADDDDLDALRKALPEHLQKAGHAMIIPVRDEHDRWQFVDLGYFFPWTYWTDFAHGVGAGAVDLVTKGEAGKLGEALAGTGILGGPIPDLLAAIKTGKDPFSGREIVREGATAADRWKAWTAYLWNMAMPTWLAGTVFHDQAPMRGALAHLYEAVTGEVDKRGEPRSTVPQALARFAGVNVYGVDPVKSRQRTLLYKKYEISKVKQMMNAIARDQSLDKETRDAQVVEYKAKIQRMVKDMQDYLKESVVAPELR